MPKYCRDTFITTKILLYYWIDLSNWAVSYATGKSVRHIILRYLFAAMILRNETEN